MSLADDFLQAAGGTDQGPQGSLSAQFAQAVKGPVLPQKPNRPLQPPKPETFLDKLLNKIPIGVANNPAVAGARSIVTQAAAPVMGGAQLIANAIPRAESVAKAILPSAVGQYLPDSQSTADTYNKKIADMLRQGREARSEQPPIVGAANEFAGSVISPANLAFGAAATTPAVTTGARAVQGAAIGAGAGAMTPVDVGPSGKYFGQKAAQIGIGTVTGGLLTPLVGAIGDAVLSRINAKNFNPGNAAKDADEIINSALTESNQKLEDIPQDQLDKLRTQTIDALSKGKQLDAAAALRLQDFNREGVQGTQGQITRDPMQFADEQTMKAMSRPLSQALEAGNKKVMQGITQYGVNAQESPVASAGLADALRSYDSSKAAGVSQAYATARANASGLDEIPMQGLAQDVAGFVDTLPANVKNSLPLGAFDKYGIFGGKQTKVMTYDDAENLLQTLNASKNNDPATVRAIGKINGFVKGAIAQGGDAGPYAPARQLAAQRFAEQDSIPALGAAANNEAGDNFVQKYVINGQTADVQKLAALLKTSAPDSFDQVRQQIGAELSRKAFGENVAADKAVAQESYNRALRTLGTGKLEAFFEPQEVDQLKRLGRIASYQQSNPAAAATNFSNTAGAMANLLRSMPGGIPIASKTIQTAGEKLGGYAAIHPSLPMTPNLTPEQRQMLSRALLGLTGGASLAVPGGIGQQP